MIFLSLSALENSLSVAKPQAYWHHEKGQEILTVQQVIHMAHVAYLKCTHCGISLPDNKGHSGMHTAFGKPGIRHLTKKNHDGTQHLPTV